MYVQCYTIQPWLLHGCIIILEGHYLPYIAVENLGMRVYQCTRFTEQLQVC